MPTTVNLSVGSGETKNLTFNCGGTFVPDDIEFVITGSGGDTNTTLSGIAYCSTGASTTAKVATMPGFALSSGQRIILYLSTTNSKASATLNVNSTGAKTIKIGGANTTTSNFTAGYWICNYDGSYWNAEKMDNSKMANGAGYTTNTGTVTGVTVGSTAYTPTNGVVTIPAYPTDTNTTTSGFAYCSSGGHTKTATIPNFELVTNQWFLIHFEVGHTLSQTVTLNINNTGAKTVSSVNGVALNTTNFSIFSNGLYYCKYNGTSYELKFAQSRPYYSYVVGNSSSLVTTGGVTNGNVYLNLVEHSVGVCIAGGDSSVHIEGLNGITVYTDDSGVLCVDGAGCSGGGGNDRNYYPTAMSWTNGTSSGPTATITMSGTNNISVGAIPSANGTTNSGIVTTGAQDFGGVKTFLSEPKIKVGTIKVANNNNTYYTQTFPKQNGTVTNGTGTSGYLAKWTGANTIGNGPQLGSSTTTFLRNDGTWATPSGGGGSTVSFSDTTTHKSIEIGELYINNNLNKICVPNALTSYLPEDATSGTVRPVSLIAYDESSASIPYSVIENSIDYTPTSEDILFTQPTGDMSMIALPVTVMVWENTDSGMNESIPVVLLPAALLADFGKYYSTQILIASKPKEK